METNDQNIKALAQYLDLLVLQTAVPPKHEAPLITTSQQLNTWLGLPAIKAALAPQPHTMPLSLGQIAYEAYCETRNWHSVTDQLLPPWHDQTPELKTAWDAAAEAIRANLSQPSSLSPSGATPRQASPRGLP